MVPGQLSWLATGFATGLPVGVQHDPGINWMIWEITMVPKSAVLHYQPRKELWWLYCLFFPRTACPTHQVGKKNGTNNNLYNIYIPESSKGVKFVPLNHQKQTWGMKFDTLGGSRYFQSIRKGYSRPGFAISFLANSICTIKTLNNFKNRIRQSQNKQTPSTKKGEWNHTMRPISTSKAQSMMAAAIALNMDTIHVHKRKRLIPPSNVRKTFTNILLPFRTRNYNIILAPAAHAPCRAAIRCNGGSCRSNLLIRALEIR